MCRDTIISFFLSFGQKHQLLIQNKIILVSGLPDFQSDSRIHRGHPERPRNGLRRSNPDQSSPTIRQQPDLPAKPTDFRTPQAKSDASR